MDKPVIALDVVEMKSGKTVHRIDMGRETNERRVEKVLSGLLRQMDTDRFFVTERLEGDTLPEVFK